MAALMTVPPELAPLPTLIDQTASALASARTSAQVLEAKEQAAAIYDAVSRMTRKKAAHDHVIALALRLQGQALKIEARAKERLADEYDAAQHKGEVGRSGARTDLVRDGNEVIPPAIAVGLTRKDVYEARRIRDAERADPGAIERSIEARVAHGEAPTRAALKRDLGIAQPSPPPAAQVDPTAEYRKHAAYVLIHPYCRFGLDPENDALIRAMLPLLTSEERQAIRQAADALVLLAKELSDD